MEDEVERIRAEKMKRLEENLQEQQFRSQMEAAKKSVLFKFMTKDARERLGAVRSVKPEVAEQVELGLLQAVQMGQIKGQITDNMLKAMLNELNPKREFRIR